MSAEYNNYPTLSWSGLVDGRLESTFSVEHWCCQWQDSLSDNLHSWQTRALAMHLPLAHSVSMPVIFCLLPVILYFTYLLQTSEQHVWELLVLIQFTGLTLHLRVTPMNGFEACPLVKSELCSLDFVVNRFFMKMFGTNNINLVRDMQFLFGFSLPSELWSNRVKSFDVKYGTCGGRFVSYGL